MTHTPNIIAINIKSNSLKLLSDLFLVPFTGARALLAVFARGRYDVGALSANSGPVVENSVPVTNVLTGDTVLDSTCVTSTAGDAPTGSVKDNADVGGVGGGVNMVSFSAKLTRAPLEIRPDFMLRCSAKRDVVKRGFLNEPPLNALCRFIDAVPTCDIGCKIKQLSRIAL